MVKLLAAIHLLDLRTFDWCLKRHYRQPIVQLSRWVSHTADGHLYGVLGIVLIALEHWLMLQVLLIGFVCERTVYFILKNRLRRLRPQQAIPFFTSVIQPSDQFSFPSGHTSAAFLMVGILSAFYPVLVLPLALWAVMVAISRVMLGVHFPTDTVAGAALGYSMSIFALAVSSL